MNKKIILLMLALPLILMLSLFTATSTVSLIVSVSVSGIELHEDEIVYVDLEETYDISYTVYPTNAANTQVTYSTSPVGEETFAKLSIENGTITPESCGKAIVTVRTADGGYQDSFIVSVYTDKLQAITATADTSTVELGGTAQITTEFIPVNTPYTQRALGYQVTEGADVVSVNSAGKVKGLSVGTATVRVYCLVNEDVFYELDFTVENSAPVQFTETHITNTVLQSGGVASLFVDGGVTLDEAPTVSVFDENGDTSTALNYELDLANGTLTYTFTSDEESTLTVRITTLVNGEPFTSECQITRISQIKAEWVNGNPNPIMLSPGGEYTLEFEVKPNNVQVTCTVTVSNTQSFVVDDTNVDTGVIKITANADATQDEMIITLTVTDEDGNQVQLTQTFIVWK